MIERQDELTRKKQKKAKGIRDTSEAEWKKRNKLERPTLRRSLEDATFGRRSAFGMEPCRNDPRAGGPTNLQRFLLFPPLPNSPNEINFGKSFFTIEETVEN
ncbi:hypothetical protein BCE02nite_14390 [Brevibacillus centrosporus]|nr:hypothetical protein EDM55_09370 [Brevibacillus centrosporus]GED30298.1 hypothetical protein BCE02nite_14390 [Brevibacillus centrosporus]